MLRASSPGVHEDISDLEDNPDYVKSQFAGLCTYTQQPRPSASGGVGGTVAYASAPDGSFLVLSINDDCNRIEQRFGLTTVVLAVAAEKIGRWSRAPRVRDTPASFTRAEVTMSFPKRNPIPIISVA